MAFVIPPTFSLTGLRNAEIGWQLKDWARREGSGAVSDSSTGFVLPSGARRSADVQGFWHLCPDFVIELRSETDRLRVLRAKMREWTDNGAKLAWLIDPERQVVEIYRPGRDPESLAGAGVVDAEGPVAGFRLELARIWDPLG